MAIGKPEIEKIKNQLITLTGEFRHKHVKRSTPSCLESSLTKWPERELFHSLPVDWKYGPPPLSMRSERLTSYTIENSPYTSYDTVIEHFDVSKSTVGQKSKLIRDMFNMQYFDAEFSTKVILKDNPFNRLAMVNGFLIVLDH